MTFPLDFFVVRYTVQRFVQRCRCSHRFGGWCCRNEWDEEDDEHDMEPPASVVESPWVKDVLSLSFGPTSTATRIAA